jgi:hypothetical protein
MARPERLAAGLAAAIALSAIAAAAGSAAPPSGGPDRPDETTQIGNPRDLLAAYFREDDLAARKRLAARFAGIRPRAWGPFRALLHEAAPREDLAPGVHNLRTPIGEALPHVDYVLRVPDGYAPNASQGRALVIGCHSAGGRGRGFLDRLVNLLGPDADRYLLACPDAPEKGPYRAGQTTQTYPLAVLADVRRRANVDCDRVILTGYSKGGYVAWGTALFSPGAWAGTIPMAAFPLTEARSAGAILYLPNVLKLSIQAHWGENDIVEGQTEGINTFSRDVAKEFRRLGGERFEGIEYPGEGHGLDLKADRIRAFVASARREPYPHEFRHIFHRVWQGRAWWVRAREAAVEEFDFTKPLTVPITALTNIREAQRQLYRRRALELTAVARGDPNTLVLTARNLRRIEVTIGPEMIDWSRPIKIVVNGRVARRGRMEIDWFELLETARRTHDFERLVAARLALDVPVRR